MYPEIFSSLIESTFLNDLSLAIAPAGADIRSPEISETYDSDLRSENALTGLTSCLSDFLFSFNTFFFEGTVLISDSVIGLLFDISRTGGSNVFTAICFEVLFFSIIINIEEIATIIATDAAIRYRMNDFLPDVLTFKRFSRSEISSSAELASIDLNPSDASSVKGSF